MGKAKPRRIKATLSEPYGDFGSFFRQVATDQTTLYIAELRNHPICQQSMGGVLSVLQTADLTRNYYPPAGT